MGHGGRGGRCGDGAVPARRAQPAHRSIQLGLYVFVHLVELERRRWIAFQKDLVQPDGPQRLGKGLFQHAVFGPDDFRAAAADIDDQRAFAVLRPDALHPQVNQARLLAAGDDFHRRTGRFRGPRQELVRIAGVADSAGGDSAYPHHVEFAVHRGHPGEHGAGGAQCLFADGAGAEYALAQTCHFAFGCQDAGRLSGDHLGRFHADRVAADIDGCVTGHYLHANRHKRGG